MVPLHGKLDADLKNHLDPRTRSAELQNTTLDYRLHEPFSLLDIGFATTLLKTACVYFFVCIPPPPKKNLFWGWLDLRINLFKKNI